MRWSSGDSDLMTVSFSKTGTHFSQILFSDANFKSPKKVPGNVTISPIQTGWRVYLQWNLAVEYSWRQGEESHDHARVCDASRSLDVAAKPPVCT